MKAAESGISFSEMVSRCLRDAVSKELAPEHKFQMVTFDGGGEEAELTPRQLAAAIEDEDRRQFGGDDITE